MAVADDHKKLKKKKKEHKVKAKISEVKVHPFADNVYEGIFYF